MTLLGASATFNMGSTTGGGGDSTMGKSLDEMIQDRRKSQQQESKRGPKRANVADRSIASGRAKRDAAVKARRGLSESKKPTKMEVDREMKRQSLKSATEKKKKEKKATHGRIAPDSTGRSKIKKAKAKQDPPAAIYGSRAPPKKAIEAAISGMESAGFKIPDGHQMVMTFVPAAPALTGPGKEALKKPDGGGKGKKGGGPPKKGNNNGGGKKK